MILKTPLHLIDCEAITRFSRQHQQALALPESIREEYTLCNAAVMAKRQPSPTIQYKGGAVGYEFSWGHILERRTQQFVIWDYCLTQLLTQYLQSGLRLADLQRVVFNELERRVICTSRDMIPVLSMEDGWQICPGSAVGVFSQVTHFSQEQAARDWVTGSLITEKLPTLITAAKQHVYHPHSH